MLWITFRSAKAAIRLSARSGAGGMSDVNAVSLESGQAESPQLGRSQHAAIGYRAHDFDHDRPQALTVIDVDLDGHVLDRTADDDALERADIAIVAAPGERDQVG